MKKLLIVLVIAGYFAWDYFKSADVVKLPPGVEAYAQPRIMPLSYSDMFVHKEHELTPKADFDMMAKVLSQEPYYFDRGAKVSPMDWALGWQVMSDQAIVDQFSFRQNMRWFSWQSERLPIRKLDAQWHMANIHIIPGNEEIALKMKTVRTPATSSRSAGVWWT